MNKVKVLIVDDSSVMRKIVERSLRQSGLEISQVLEAANGDDALKVLATEQVDIILTDINMPVMNGLELVRRLSDLGTAAKVPIVMITTEAGEAQVLEAVSNGARGYIRKPFTPEQVREQVMPLLGA